MQYISRLLTGTEERFKPTRARSNTPRLEDDGCSNLDIDKYHQIFKFIKDQTFENNKDLDPRICKLSITLLLLGVDKTDLPFIFETTTHVIQKHVSYTIAYLKEKSLILNNFKHI